MYPNWSKWRRNNEPKYAAIHDEEGSIHSEDGLLPSEKNDIGERSHEKFSMKKLLLERFWIAATFVFVLATITLALENRRLKNTPSYENGFKTDLGVARGIAGLVEYTFTGGLELDSDNKLYRVAEPGAPQYVGEPSREIDDAWEDIMTASEIVLDGAEAKEVAGKTIEEPDGHGWRLELDAYHSLHCVNEIRKALDTEHYYPNGTPYFFRVHIDHCLDYLRQVVQCQADLTPLTFYWEEKVNASLPIFGHAHTCRDWSQIHEWSMLRRGVEDVA